MLHDYSRTGTFAEAVKKTFDGRHPCKLCLKIQKGAQEERRHSMVMVLEKQPQFLADLRVVSIPLPQVWPGHQTAFVPRPHLDFIPIPPKPPPPRGLIPL